MNNQVIAYTIDRDINTNFYISIQNGEISVRAPWYFTKQQIQEKVEERKAWIIKKLQEYRTVQNKYESSKNVKIWGIDYKVNIIYKFCKLPTLNVENNNINIVLPNKYKKINKDSILEILINKMYEKVIKEEIENVMEKTRILLGFAPEDYKIENINNKLGECVNNIITINPEIVRFNKKVLEYVVFHEYCHLKYKTHSKGFYQIIKRYIPNFEKYENLISQYKY